jgi:hypothetical protein
MRLTGHGRLGGGGFQGIIIDKIFINPQKLPLKQVITTEFFKDDYKPNLDNFEDVTSLRGSFKQALVDRETPGAGPGQTAYILHNNDRAFRFYCGDCDNQTTNKILSSFESPIVDLY